MKEVKCELSLIEYIDLGSFGEIGRNVAFHREGEAKRPWTLETFKLLSEFNEQYNGESFYQYGLNHCGFDEHSIDLFKVHFDVYDCGENIGWISFELKKYGVYTIESKIGNRWKTVREQHPELFTSFTFGQLRKEIEKHVEDYGLTLAFDVVEFA